MQPEYVDKDNSIQFFILSRLHILQQQEVYIYKMQFSIGSMAAKINYAYTKIKLTNKHELFTFKLGIQHRYISQIHIILCVSFFSFYLFISIKNSCKSY